MSEINNDGLNFIENNLYTFEYHANGDNKKALISPLKLGKIPKFMSEIMASGDFLNDIFTLFNTHGSDGVVISIFENSDKFGDKIEHIIKALSIASDIPIEDLNDLELDQIIILIMIIIEKNQNLFKKKMPIMKEMYNRIKMNGQ